jgi:hypothetical protein
MPWNTPQILKTSGLAATVAATLLMVAVIAGARTHRHEIQAIGRDSAPSIIAAEQIRAALSDMDAMAAEEDRRRFEARRIEAVSALVTAAENITYGEDERTPIRKLAVGIGTYGGMVQNARNKRDVELYRQAARFMDTELLPSAAALREANRAALQRTWEEQNNNSRRSLFLTIAAGIILGGLLLAIQVFLAQRMRRTLNPGLFAATVVAWVFVVYAGQSFNNADRDLRIAKQDAFESMLALWQARSLAYAANGDQSRALLDAPDASMHQKAFVEKDGRIRDAIARELNNITFPDEREPAEETQARYLEYRKLEQAGQHKAASAAFAQFDEVLGKTLKVNQDAFDSAVHQGFEDVANFELAASLTTAAICALVWLGLRPRLREYTS